MALSKKAKSIQAIRRIGRGRSNGCQLCDVLDMLAEIPAALSAMQEQIDEVNHQLSHIHRRRRPKSKSAEEALKEVGTVTGPEAPVRVLVIEHMSKFPMGTVFRMIEVRRAVEELRGGTLSVSAVHQVVERYPEIFLRLLGERGKFRLSDAAWYAAQRAGEERPAETEL